MAIGPGSMLFIFLTFSEWILYTDKEVGRVEEPEDREGSGKCCLRDKTCLLHSRTLCSCGSLHKLKSTFQQVAPMGLSGLLAKKGEALDEKDVCVGGEKGKGVRYT